MVRARFAGRGKTVRKVQHGPRDCSGNAVVYCATACVARGNIIGKTPAWRGPTTTAAAVIAYIMRWVRARVRTCSRSDRRLKGVSADDFLRGGRTRGPAVRPLPDGPRPVNGAGEPSRP